MKAQVGAGCRSTFGFPALSLLENGVSAGAADVLARRPGGLVFERSPYLSAPHQGRNVGRREGESAMGVIIVMTGLVGLILSGSVQAQEQIRVFPLIKGHTS